MKNQIQLNKVGKRTLRFHQRQLEIAAQCFEEVQKKPAGVF